MELGKGFGTLLLTEPVTVRDVLHTLSYGNRVLILYVVGLMRQVITEDLISIGVPLDSASTSLRSNLFNLDLARLWTKVFDCPRLYLVSGVQQKHFHPPRPISFLCEFFC